MNAADADYLRRRFMPLPRHESSRVAGWELQKMMARPAGEIRASEQHTQTRTHLVNAGLLYDCSRRRCVKFIIIVRHQVAL